MTIVEGIYALPAGHYAVWRNGKFTIKSYWKLSQEIDEDTARLSGREISEQLRRLLEDSVRLRLISDVPLGAFLSGGIDSSAIVALMSQVSDIPPRTVSIVFQEKEFSEAPYMRMVVRRFGTEHKEVLLTVEDMLKELPKALAAMDQPTFDGVNTYIVSKHTKEAGLTVALLGVGGDELFAGYEGFRWAPRLQMLRRWAPGPIGWTIGKLIRLTLQGSDRGRKLSRWFGGEYPDGNAYLLVRELFSPADIRRLVPDLPRDLLLPSEELNGFSDSDPVNWVSRCELSYYMRNVLLRDTDAMSMAHSLEVRVPFLDHRLVEFVLSLPGELKLDSSMPKPLLIKSLKGALPDELIYRRKQGFTLPFSIWMRGALKRRIEQVLLDTRSGGEVADVLEHRMVRGIWERFLRGRANWVRPWALYVLKKVAEVIHENCR